MSQSASLSSLQNTAERAAAIMLECKNVFPNVVIGDIEPFPALTDQPNWQNDYREWMAAFRTAMGQPIAFLQIDINWSKPNWQGSLRQTAGFARGAQLPIGIIYNGNVHGVPNPNTKKWLDSAVANFTQIETQLGIVPDQVIFTVVGEISAAFHHGLFGSWRGLPRQRICTLALTLITGPGSMSAPQIRDADQRMG